MVPGGGYHGPAGLWDSRETTGGRCFTASAPAGLGSDDKSVLDPALRVRGVERLRVIDASSSPGSRSQYQCEQPDDRGKGAALVMS